MWLRFAFSWVRSQKWQHTHVAWWTVIWFHSHSNRFLTREENISIDLEDEKPQAESLPKFRTSAGLEPETSCGDTVANDGVCSHLQITRTISRRPKWTYHPHLMRPRVVSSTTRTAPRFPEQPWQGTKPYRHRTVSRYALPISAIPPTRIRSRNGTSICTRNRSRGEEKNGAEREADHLDTHARGAHRRTAARCRRERRRLIGGERGWLYCAAHFDRWGVGCCVRYLHSALCTPTEQPLSSCSCCRRVSQRDF
jgi:hypothetical protein